MSEASFQENLRSAVAARTVSVKGYRDDLPGIFFRSRWEANYARYLQILLEAGEILLWEHEPETFWFLKIKRGVRSYKPDFRVTALDGSVRYVEIKGWMDPQSKTKLKRMRIYHSDVVIDIIDEKAYKALEKEIGWQIFGWEFSGKMTKKMQKLVEGADSPKGLFATLSPEQQKCVLEYRGPENFGDPSLKRRKPKSA